MLAPRQLEHEVYVSSRYNYYVAVTLASHADVLRLVTRSSTNGEERVTSLRTSA